MIKPGDQITVIGNRAKNGTNTLRLQKVVLSNNPIDALNAECLFGTGRDFRIGSQAAHALASGSLGAVPLLSFPLRFVVVALAGC